MPMFARALKPELFKAAEKAPEFTDEVTAPDTACIKHFIYNSLIRVIHSTSHMISTYRVESISSGTRWQNQLESVKNIGVCRGALIFESGSNGISVECSILYVKGLYY